MDEKRHKVLIVDDEPMIADTLALIFSSANYETQPAYAAEQAIEIIGEWVPDLAIIDVVLPQMNGIDFAILLKAQCPDCQLMLSGKSITSGLLAEAAKKGYTFDILAKPAHPTVLLKIALDLLTANPT